MEVYSDLYLPPFPLFCPLHPETPKSMGCVRGREWLIRAGRGFTGSGQGVLDQGISVIPSLGISTNMAKKS